MNKLKNPFNKYKQLINVLGCPPDVMLKAIEDGIIIKCVKDKYGDITLWIETSPSIALFNQKHWFEEPRLIKYNEWCFTCESGSFHGCVALKDYKKTWWLVSDEVEE